MQAIQFGYKIWCLNKPCDYLINFEIYQGKNPRANCDYEFHFGKCAPPLVKMLDDLRRADKSFRYNIFIDNHFTGPNILYSLKQNGYGVIETICEYRISRELPLTSKADMHKQAREIDSTILEKRSGVKYIRWRDNSIVTIASTFYGVQPIQNVDRFPVLKKRKFQLQDRMPY